LTSVNGQSYTYDDNGNLLSDGARTYSYDSANRLTSVLDNGVITQYEYNGDGDRTAQTIGGVRTDYVFDPVGLAQVLAETTNGQSKFYVSGLAQYEAGGWQYFGPDRLGSVRTLLNPAGELLLARNYDPFGNVLVQGGVGSSGFGYTGEQVDATGLVYLRARYYSPVVGRFLTADNLIPDPIRSQSWNQYNYVENNPIRYVDPSGRCIFSFIGPDIAEGVVNCAQSINRTIQAYRAGERNIGRLASHVTGATEFLIDQSEALNQLNEDADVVFSNSCIEDRFWPSVRLGLWATDKAFLIVGVGQGIKAGLSRESTQQTLQRLANEADAAVPGQGPVAGTRKHTRFGDLVRNLGRTDLNVERSYLNGLVARRGTRGSIRLDVVEGPLNNPIAVYDLKTGSATLSPSRIQQIQSHLPNPNTPVIIIRPQ
jgi:RHS repeat-associated protein